MWPDEHWFRALYPFQSRWLQLSGLGGPVRMHYVDKGSGPPVVMVHGNPTWSFYFRELIKALRPTHRCIAMDHIGCGLSDKPNCELRIGNSETKLSAFSRQPSAVDVPAAIRNPKSNIPDAYDYSLARHVVDLESLLDHLGLNENVTFVLHDWGGMIGMAAALRRPERVARFVILNTAAFLLPPGKRLPLRLRIIRDGGPLGSLIVRGLNGFAWPATSMAVHKKLPPDVRRAYLAPYNSWANRIAVLRFVQDIPLIPTDQSYETAKSVDDNMGMFANRPALICWGMRDFVFDADFLAEWRRRWPNAEVRSFPDAGHYVLEDERDAIIERVGRFLSTSGRAQAHP